MGAVPGLDLGGTGTQGLQTVGGMPYVLPGGKSFGFASIPAGHVMLGGGTGTPTGLALFETGNIWTATQNFTVTSGTPMTWGRTAVKARMTELIAGDFQIRVNEAADGTKDDVTKPSWALRFGIFADDFAVYRAAVGGTFVFPALRLVNTGRLGINHNDPSAQLHVASSSTSTVALKVESPPLSTSAAQEWHYGVTRRGYYFAGAINNSMNLDDATLGNDIVGPRVSIGRNINTGPAGSAPAAIALTEAESDVTFIWVDNSGIIRRSFVCPTGSTASASVNGETTGTAVGDQASTRDIKTDILPVRDMSVPFRIILDASEELYSFTRKDGAYRNKHFTCGLIIDDAPEDFALDADPQHPKGKSLNIPTLFGSLIASVKYLNDWITGVDTRLHAVEDYGFTDRPRIDLLEFTVANHGTHLTSVDETFMSHAGRLIQLESGLEGLPLRVADVETLAQSHTGTLNGLASTDVTLRFDIDTAVAQNTAQQETLTDYGTRITTIESLGLAAKIAEFETRIAALEALP